MHVKKLKINVNDVSDDLHIKIPLTTNHEISDKDTEIDEVLVKKEKEKSINPIIDFEKTKYSPFINDNGNLVNVINIDFTLEFKDNAETKLSDIGFENDDLKYLKNRFTKSFIGMYFFDSDVPTNQNLVSFNTIYCKLTKDEIQGYYLDGGDEINPTGGEPKDVTEIPVVFKVANPVTNPDDFAEGYYVYFFKDVVNYKDELPYELYMRVEFNNASDGKTSKFGTENSVLDVNSLLNKLHVKYLLKKDKDKYYYEVDETYSNNFEYDAETNTLGLTFYELNVI
jgi:hypothetical protein